MESLYQTSQLDAQASKKDFKCGCRDVQHQWRICTRASNEFNYIHKPIMIFIIDLTIKAEEKVLRL